MPLKEGQNGMDLPCKLFFHFHLEQLELLHKRLKVQ
jgi:hypothetical protein